MNIKGISILYIGVGRYIQFWKMFYKTCEEHFLPGLEKHYFVFTDSEKIYAEDIDSYVYRIYQEDLGGITNSLFRFGMFLQQKEHIVKQEYVIFFNANTIFKKDVLLNAIFLEEGENYLACIHPGWASADPKTFTLEKNPQSTAYIDMDKDCPKKYLMGGLPRGKEC